MSSFRININTTDQSQTVNPVISEIAGTVISSNKGPLVPIKFQRGEEQKILDILGIPSSSNSQVWDIVEYNKNFDIWVSAPSKNGKHGGVIVTKTGTRVLVGGQSTSSISDFSTILDTETIGTGDGSTVNFVATLADKTLYNYTSLVIKVDGIALTSYNITDAEPEVITATELSSGTYTRATGILNITFNSAPTTGAIITVEYTIDISASAYFALLSKNPQDNDLAVKTVYDTANSCFKVYLAILDPITNTYRELDASPYSVSVTEGAKDGFGNNIYVESVFSSDTSDYVIATAGEIAYSTFSSDTSYVLFGGGDRGDSISITEYTLGWNVYKNNTAKYNIDIFFDVSSDSGIASIFETLATTSYYPFADYILPLPRTTVATALTNRSSLGLDNKDIALYFNWGKVKDNYYNIPFYSPLIGRVAKKWAQMIDVFNGLAPAWIDENNHGGQLGSGIIEMYANPSQGEGGDLESLDNAQINPIIFDKTYGPMIVSDRTTQVSLSDYSYIPHNRVRKYLIKNIVNQVLIGQIIKLNDIYHRTVVKTLTEQIIQPLTNPSLQLISEYSVICDETNNTPALLALRKFVLTVKIKFTPFSEYIVLNFVNVGQTVSISES